MNTFKIGETYSTRSACDYDSIFYFEITARSAKFISFTWCDKPMRAGIKTDAEGNEWSMPLGRYSMAPVIHA